MKQSDTPKKLPPPDDFDDNPPLTEDFWARARPAAEVMGPAFMAKVARTPGRPKLDEPKAPLTLRVKPDVLRHLRASGPGWQTRVADKLDQLVKAGEL